MLKLNVYECHLEHIVHSSCNHNTKSVITLENALHKCSTADSYEKAASAHMRDHDGWNIETHLFCAYFWAVGSAFCLDPVRIALTKSPTDRLSVTEYSYAIVG